MLLSVKNKHPRDVRIKFRVKGRKYWIDGSTENVISCTAYISTFFENFDSDRIIQCILNSNNYKDPNYKYYNMNSDDIQNQWNDASSLGTKLHLEIEHFYNCMEHDINSTEFSYFKQFVHEHSNLEIYRTEWLIFDEYKRMTGTIDAVFIDKTDNTFVLCDWKRVEQIHEHSNNNICGKPPVNHMQDTNYSHYCLQLNLYKKILESYYDIKIKELFLVILHPKNPTYKKINVPVLEKEITNLLMLRNIEYKIPPEFIELSDEQQNVFMSILKGQNVFITAKAGCGKSHLIKLFYNTYKEDKSIALTSTTGISAIWINGCTLFSFLGIGLGLDSAPKIIKYIQIRPLILTRWTTLDILIIDEISMLNADLFDKLEAIARYIRCSKKPFGGIQLVLTGDFLQLPVVNSDKLCFEAVSWEKCVDKTFYLKKNFRQDDPLFQNCLNEIRYGELSKETKKILKSRIGAKLNNDYNIIPTKIYGLNIDVDRINEQEINKLDQTEFYEYTLEYKLYDKTIKNIDEMIKKNCLACKQLQLCIGAQVMLIFNWNIDLKLGNGSKGVVVDFNNNLPVVKFLNGDIITVDYHTWNVTENDKKLFDITQIPLKICYAITIHKSQGLTLDYAEIDLNDIFEYGQAYTAISRIKKLDGLTITRKFNFNSIVANPKAIEYYKNIELNCA